MHDEVMLGIVVRNNEEENYDFDSKNRSKENDFDSNSFQRTHPLIIHDLSTEVLCPPLSYFQLIVRE